VQYLIPVASVYPDSVAQRDTFVRHTIMGPIILVIAIVLFIGYAALITYYRKSWLQIPEYKAIPGSINTNPSTKITVIIPARNEEQNISRCLQAVIDQSYPASLFEIIVVDDHSTDNTANVVRSFTNQNIHLVFLKDFVTDTINAYKKKAIEVAIAKSTGDLIVTTDTDCFMDKEWLQTLASFYEKYRPACIAAPVSITCNNRFVEIFQALDFMTLQGITGAAVYKKMHSMCNGANFAYEKNAWFDVGGFKGIDSIASGDDMLLMHKIYKLYPDRVLFLKSREAIVHTQPMHTWKGFFNQRIRWASKADQYDDKRILPVLILVYFFNLLLLLLPVIAAFNNSAFPFFNYQSDSYRLSIIDAFSFSCGKIF
jgi:cellulose synthase/poly-beta-1,6-N-acetylglucosamine synthase-like glycosyltransferase